MTKCNDIALCQTLCRDYVTKMERLENQLMEMFYNRMVEFDTTGTLQHKRKVMLSNALFIFNSNFVSRAH